MAYIDEYNVLNDINNCLKNSKPSLDVDTYRLLDSFVENPYNTSEEEYCQIIDFINENTQITKDFAVYYSNELTGMFKHIGPYNLASPISRIKSTTFKKQNLPTQAKMITVNFKPAPKEKPKVFKRVA